MTVGESISNVPEKVSSLYEEARKAISSGAHTSAVLTCRKLLMHIAVDQGADENQNFKYYVEWLDNNSYTPPKSDKWVDHIRTKGNEANHEIVLMEAEDSEELLLFCAMLLKFLYEFPSRMEQKVAN